MTKEIIGTHFFKECLIWEYELENGKKGFQIDGQPNINYFYNELGDAKRKISFKLSMNDHFNQY